MSLFESFKGALHSVRANALRSFLSMLGIIIGVAAVITVISIGQGSRQAVLANISNMGANLITINPSLARGTAGRISDGESQTFSYDMAAEIERVVPYVHNVVPQVSGRMLLVVGTENAQVTAAGVTEPFQSVMNYRPVSGRFISEEDAEQERYVAVLGSAIADDLWPESDPVGQEVLLVVSDRRFTFSVIGVMETKGQSLGANLDNQIYLPATTMMRRLIKTDRVATYSAQALNASVAKEAVDQVTYFLTRRIGTNRFRISSQDQMMEAIGEVSQTLSLMLGGIASIALLVGGIGIMNIMLVSVTERTREIGTRKALGAKRRDILTQFMIEAFSLSATGGVVGLALGWVGAVIVANIGGWDVQITAWSITLALSFSSGIGLFFGIYPAMKASRLDPVQALSFE